MPNVQMDIDGYNIMCSDYLPQKPCPMMGNNSDTMSRQGTTVEQLTAPQKKGCKNRLRYEIVYR